MGSHIKYIYFVIVCQFIVSLKLHVSKTTFLVFVCLKLMHAIILKIEENLIVCLSHFLKICQVFPVSNYFDSIITNKRFVKRNLSKSKAEFNWSLNCSRNLIGEGQTRMIKWPSKKKIQLWYRIFIYYSLPLNPSLFFSFEQLVWHSKSLKGGIKIPIY